MTRPAQPGANKLTYVMLPKPAWPILEQRPLGLNQQRAGPPGKYAGTITVHCSAQRFPFASVLMPDQRRRLVHNPVPAIQGAKKEFLVAASQRWSPAIKRFVEKTNMIERQVASNRHIHS